MVVAVEVSMNLGNVPASMGSSYAGLCKRGGPGRFRCGDHGVKSMAFIAAGTHRAGSWRRRTAHDSSCCAYPGRRARTWSPSGRISFLYFCPRIFSYSVIRVSPHIELSENPCCVSDPPRKHRRVCCHFERRILSLRNARYVLASPRTVETAFSAPLL